MNATSAVPYTDLVERHHAALYRFAFSLAGSESEAEELTQQTFYLLVKKGHQIRDVSKSKTWLFTTMHREFLAKRRKIVRFPHYELEETEHELPAVPPDSAHRLDSSHALDALKALEEPFRAAISLFYLEDNSYQEIADILEVPVGTVKSRIARGLSRLQARLADPTQMPGQVTTHHHG